MHAAITSLKNTWSAMLLMSLLLLFSCNKPDTAPEPAYAPNDVLVKTKGGVRTADVFKLINALGLEVSTMHTEVFTSSLPPDSLASVLAVIDSKTYTSDEVWSVAGYVHAPTGTITLLPYFFAMHNQNQQTDWLATMEELKLQEQGNGFVIHFKVPAGKEKEWVHTFKMNAAVEWAELNYIGGFSTM